MPCSSPAVWAYGLGGFHFEDKGSHFFLGQHGPTVIAAETQTVLPHDLVQAAAAFRVEVAVGDEWNATRIIVPQVFDTV